MDEFRDLWESAEPTVSQRLAPDRVLGLHFPSERFEKFLAPHVDTNGDCLTLINEIKKRNLLTPQLVNKHEGLIAACVEQQPEWLTAKMLVGEVLFGSGMKPQACLMLRVLKMLERHMRSAGAASEGAVLTAQNCKHLSAFLMSDCVSGLAIRTNMMYQAMPALMKLVLDLCFPPTGKRAKPRQEITAYTTTIITAPNTPPTTPIPCMVSQHVTHHFLRGLRHAPDTSVGAEIPARVRENRPGGSSRH